MQPQEVRRVDLPLVFAHPAGEDAWGRAGADLHRSGLASTDSSLHYGVRSGWSGQGHHAAFDLADWSIYRYFVIPGGRLGAVAASRGCNFTCTFCSQQQFWQRSWRRREPAKVVDEIRQLNQRWGVNVVLLTDEYPTKDAAAWEEFLDRMISLRRATGREIHLLMETRAPDIVRDRAILPKYRQAGIVHVYVGLEATDQETLDRVDKRASVEQAEPDADPEPVPAGTEDAAGMRIDDFEQLPADSPIQSGLVDGASRSALAVPLIWALSRVDRIVERRRQCPGCRRCGALRTDLGAAVPGRTSSMDRVQQES